MKYKEQEHLVSDLRELADFYERPEAIALPFLQLYETFYVQDYGYDQETRSYRYNHENSKKKLKRVVAVLGSCTKDWQDHNLRVIKKIGHSIQLIFQVDREAVCSKKLTGNKIIHAAATHYTPERVEEEFEWVCDEVSLLAD
jgi:hypothetical protein